MTPVSRSTRRDRRLPEYAARARLTNTASVVYQTKSSVTTSAPISSVVGNTDPRSPTNCGNRAMKKIASFGLATDVTSPSRNGRRPARGTASRGRPACLSDCTPSQTRTHAPVTFNTRNATSDAAINADTPSTESRPQTTTPTELPAIVSTPDRQPPRNALRTTLAVPAPGVMVTRTAIGRKAQSMLARIRGDTPPHQGGLPHGRTARHTAGMPRAVILTAVAAAAALAVTSAQAETKPPRCFGAASRDFKAPCHNPRLRRMVKPTPAAALLAPNGFCSPDKADPLVCGSGALPQVATQTVALVGDSHAKHWRAALNVVAKSRGWRLSSLTLT